REITRGGRDYRFVDTAGIRRKGKTKLVAEKLSVVMARRGLERSDVALLVIDGEQGVTQGDATIAGYAEQSGRSIILVVNKWDLALAAAREAALSDAATAKGKSRQSLSENRDPANIDPGKLMSDYENMIRAKLKFLSYAPIVFLSAKTGHRAEKLLPLINQCADARLANHGKEQPMRATLRAARRLCLALAIAPCLATAAPPVAPVKPVTDTYFGTTLTDPYRYMED